MAKKLRDTNGKSKGDITYYFNIRHHLNFYDIHLKPNIFSKLWSWLAICNQNLLTFGFDFDDITTGHRGGKFQYVTTG